ncbi:uncharacterized protein LOC113363126 [Ctenocephalides felis]|uniref:uncharacterized protein LOC113363126 n=1 Tax=Ctenocephalides felis TaxID=7515 RepID=UPI000E6E1F48|nr:uncharacterized protein LOC113363126 [Ctenocephalides felis]
MASNLPKSSADVLKEDIFQAIRNNDLPKVQSLLNFCSVHLLNIVDKTNKNNTPLHCAVEENRYEIVKELLLEKWGTNINAQNDDGDTALHVGAKKNSDRLIYLLLKKGAICDAVNKDGKTFLDVVKILATQPGFCKSKVKIEKSMDKSNQPQPSGIVTGKI